MLVGVVRLYSVTDSLSQLLFDDLTVSFRHLKIYSVIFEESGQSEVKPLVYAEDLSSNGSYWNGSLIGRGNNGVLLSNLDEIRVSQRISVIFHSVIDHDVVDVDEVQQSDTKVIFRHCFILLPI